MDRINDLSDEIICHILSFLSIKESALTSVLSTRWRYLFALTPNLQIEDDLQEGCGKSFMDFVRRVLSVSSDFPIGKFSVKCRKSIDSGDVTGWMYDVLKRGVLSLDIDVIGHEVAILVPPEMFTCKTIVELKLATEFKAMLPEDVSLPSLKSLVLGSIYFFNSDECVLRKLLSACPSLEELTIRSGRWQNGDFCRTVSSSSLKKLTLECNKSYHFYWYMSLDTPSLVYLEYSGSVLREYPLVNLESLVEAKLDLWLDVRFGNPTNLIKGLRNVEVLELSSVDTSKMFYHFSREIPVLNNLLRLSITTSMNSDTWECFPILLQKSPNLQVLVVKGPLYDVKPTQEYGLLCPVKVLKITEYRGKIGELIKLKHFLLKLSSLELVKVRAFAVKDPEKSEITKDLLRLPRSSNCNIQIKFL